MLAPFSVLLRRIAPAILALPLAAATFTEREQTVSGTVEDSSTHVCIVVKSDAAGSAGTEREYLATVTPGATPTAPGTWTQRVRYFPGQNSVDIHSARATVSRKAHLKVDPAELRVRLDWAGNDHDYDLYVNDIYYNNMQAGGGVLDRDAYASRGDTGPGVENVTFAEAAPGVYQIYVNYYSDHENGGSDPTTVSILLKGREIFRRTRTITQFENKDASLAGDGKSVWNVATVIIHAATPGGYRVIDDAFAEVLIGRRDIFIGAADKPVVIRGTRPGIFPRTDYSVDGLTGPKGATRVLIGAGQSTQITAEGNVNQSSGNDETVSLLGKFQSSDATVGAIDDLGVLTGLKAGKTTITVQGGSSTLDVFVMAVDLDADSNHDGDIQHSAVEEGRERTRFGLVCLPNWDDDDGQNGPDAAVPNSVLTAFNNAVDGDDDKADLRDLKIARSPQVPAGGVLTLRYATPADASKFRVFDENFTMVLGPGTTPKTTFDIPNPTGAAGSYLTYHVEGIVPGAEGDLELILKDGGTAVPGASDRIVIKVAPFLLAPNHWNASIAVIPPVDAVASHPLFTPPPTPTKSNFNRNDLLNHYRGKVADARLGLNTGYFLQDPIQGGYASCPAPGGGIRTMKLVLRMPFPDLAGADPWPYNDAVDGASNTTMPKLLGRDIGVIEPPNLVEEASPGFGGNHEISWPEAKDERTKKAGRLCIGKESGLVKAWLKDQQKTQLEIIEPALNWLSVKHIDEIVHFIKPKEIAIADPALAEKLLTDWRDANPGKTSEPLFYEGQVQGIGSVAALLAAPDLMFGGNAVETRWVKLQAPLTAVTAMENSYIHFMSGGAKYQTFKIMGVDGPNNALRIIPNEGAASIWRAATPGLPAAADQCYIVTAPLCHGARNWLNKAGGTEHTPLPITLSIGELLGRNGGAATARVDAFWSVNTAANGQIKTIETLLKNELGIAEAAVRRLPVLFWNHGFTAAASQITAFTPNLVNGVLIGNSFGMPRPFVLSPGRNTDAQPSDDIFRVQATQALGQGYTAEYINDWYVWHFFDGEVHCSAEVLREPRVAEVPKWW